MFQSTRPMRGATLPTVITTNCNGFQSTRPMRGATDHRQQAQRSHHVSIHAPHAGRDLIRDLASRISPMVSIHAPHAGRD